MDLETFIDRWTAREGGAERANYQMFLSELCDVIGVKRPDPPAATTPVQQLRFRARRHARGRAMAARLPNASTSTRKGSFILEAKQSRLPGKENAIDGQLSLLGAEPNNSAGAASRAVGT